MANRIVVECPHEKGASDQTQRPWEFPLGKGTEEKRNKRRLGTTKSNRKWDG
jgi:hypothetical protein